MLLMRDSALLHARIRLRIGAGVVSRSEARASMLLFMAVVG